MNRSFALVLILVLVPVLAAAQDLGGVDFHLRDVNGDDQSFQEYLASVRGSDDAPKKGLVMISFWALWCNPCKAEMKALVDLYDAYKDKNFHYLAINEDNPRSFTKVKSYVTAEELPYTFWLDPNAEVFKKLNGQNLPYSLLVTETGKLVKKRTGFLPGDEKEIELDLKKYLQ
jgi:thiol-disulfide isomerase/thioredoxin